MLNEDGKMIACNETITCRSDGALSDVGTTTTNMAFLRNCKTYVQTARLLYAIAGDYRNDTAVYSTACKYGKAKYPMPALPANAHGWMP
jgi:hypothetical protein